MFHHLAAELGPDDYLVRSLSFEYDEREHLTYLDSITQTGYIRNADGSPATEKSLPPLTFTYQKPVLSNIIKEITPENIVNAPVGLDQQSYQWTDLYSEGISGILSEQAAGWYYKENKGDGTFSSARLVYPRPSFSGMSAGSLSIQDLEADGKKYLVNTDPAVRGYFELTAEDEWLPFTTFPSYPNIALNDPNLKWLDLNGDGMPEMLLSREQDFIWYASRGKQGFDDYRLVSKAGNEEDGPVIVFEDKDERMLLAIADMSGDGLADIVIITNASVCYYPNLGYGRFGAKVNMGISGTFDRAELFNPKYIHLADIDGSGTTDIIYTGKNEVTVWFNQSGNKFSTPDGFINPFPQIDNYTRISFVDLLGNGTSCMVWASSLPVNQTAPLRYIDLMNGAKPHVMVRYKNNSGKEVSLHYKSSTHFYLHDKEKGRKWVTRLPFPVQCLSKMVTVDKVSETRFVNEYAYHHGYYDAIEREFRGFAMVEQTDTENYEHYIAETQAAGMRNITHKEFYQPAVKTCTWFHTGAYFNRELFFHRLQEEYYSQKHLLPATPFQEQLTTEELVQCCRALKGLPLRQEVYSDEGSSATLLHPYTVTQYNYEVSCLHHKGDGEFAVFFPKQKEQLVFNYERNPLNPRIAHSITIDSDQYGNIKESASIVYGRENADISLPLLADRDQQKRQHVLYTFNQHTSVIDDTTYRLPVLCGTQTWELNTEAPPSLTFFTAAVIRERFTTADIVKYEEDAVLKKKRLIEHSATLFLKDDLSGPEQVGRLGSRGLPYENYLLAFTPSLWDSIYRNKADDNLLRQQGKYVQFQNDGQYWIRSGRTYFQPVIGNPDEDFAKKNFFLPVVYEDSCDHVTQISYDDRKLFIQKVTDAAGNEITVTHFNYRTLQPYCLKDPNGNCSGVRFDALGLVTHTFVMGKDTERKGDWMNTASTEYSLQDQPTTFLEYDFSYHRTNGTLPNVVKSHAREKHHFKEEATVANPVTENNTRWQQSYSYSDGGGHEVLKKVQAEPGDAPERDAQGKLVKDATGKLQYKNTGAALRWIGNGRTIVNNKGNAVKQYEPFFDSSPSYNTEEELVELGFTPIIHYDALGRAIRTDLADGSFSKVVFDNWLQQTWDQNDTLKEPDCRWYQDRVAGLKKPEDKEAAIQTELHAGTFTTVHLDSLARPFLSVAHNKEQRTQEGVTEKFLYTRTYLDVEGNAKRVTQVKDNNEQEIMTWRYDMLGNICYQHSTDAGDRWILRDVTGKPVRLWDARKNTFLYGYDKLHRPLQLTIQTDAGEAIVYEKYEYGDAIAHDPALNLRGKLYKQYDTAGIAINEAFDFKGNLLRSSRELVADHTITPNWNIPPATTHEIFTNEITYDALNRPVLLKSPDNSLTIPAYNEANLLNSLQVMLKGNAVATRFITNIDYNAKGQREAIDYDNGTSTKYTYEPETNRLTSLVTTRLADATILQHLQYTYDAVGNITRQYDNAQKTVFYGGQKIDAASNYIYDAIYRLIEAGGREHMGQVPVAGVTNDNYKDDWCRMPLQPNSPVQLRQYSEKYFYDEVGNITRMRHIAGATGSWTRDYIYNAGTNQLQKTTMGNEALESTDYSYTYNPHGSMLTMPHLRNEIDWNFREEMRHIDLGGGGEAWYVYDSAGQRVRKIVIKAQQTEERIYLGGYEVYRVYENGYKTLERETLHVMDGQQRIAMVDTKSPLNGAAGEQLIRYQYANHLGTACLELDHEAKIITYEEYHPYGTTAYQATDSSRQVPVKRYRYTGMERDEESGFNYHSARYYVPWLGRWMAVDPAGLTGGRNFYQYAFNNPITFKDVTGRFPMYWHEVHEAVSKQALQENKAAVDHTFKGKADDFRKGIRDGVRWNDMPDGWSSKGIYDRGNKGEATEKDKKTDTYRSHFGENQFWHSMTPPGAKGSADVKGKIMAQANAWFDAALAVKDKDPRAAGELMGHVLHMVQDSWSPSHTSRNKDGTIKEFYDFAKQDSADHEKLEAPPSGVNPEDYSTYDGKYPGTENAKNMSTEIVAAFLAGDKAKFQEILERNYKLEAPKVKEAPEILRPEKAKDREVIVKKGDTLWGIAKKEYGDAKMWTTIWQQNKKNLKSGNPDLIFPGEVIRIKK